METIYGPFAMTDSTPQRGRPKGSGIDDRIWLREMERLMRIDPALRPTSAIKALGVTDPSAIRRLRDKYMARNASHSSRHPVRHRVAVQAAAKDPVVRQRSTGPRLVSKDDLHVADGAAKDDGRRSDICGDACSALWGIAFQTANLVAQMNMLALLSLARTPAASLALQQQIALGDAFASALRAQAKALARAKR